MLNPSPIPLAQPGLTQLLQGDVTESYSGTAQMFSKLLITALAACAAAALTAGAASAKVTFYPYGVGAPTLTKITDFSADALNSAPIHAPLGWSWSGNGVVLHQSTSVGAKPAVKPGHKPFGSFMAVAKGKSETLTIPASAKIEDLNIYTGSLDSFNLLTFDLAGGATQTYSGVTLASLTGAQDSGNQNSGHSNGILNFTFNAPVEKIIFQSTGYSFEIASIAAQIASGVPEPSEWLLLTLGVAMLGAFARRRRSFVGAAAVA